MKTVKKVMVELTLFDEPNGQALSEWLNFWIEHGQGLLEWEEVENVP